MFELVFYILMTLVVGYLGAGVLTTLIDNRRKGRH